MVQVHQIDHIELFVPDRYEAARWYREVFGLEIVRGFEAWADDGGPLMISGDDGSTKLALFEGAAPGFTNYSGFHRVAFRVDGAGFVTFLARLETLNLMTGQNRRLSAADVVDHVQSWSIYFFDPYGYRFEITTYDYDTVASALHR